MWTLQTDGQRFPKWLKVKPHTTTHESLTVRKNKVLRRRIDLDFNGYYTSHPKEKGNIETRGE